MRRIKIKVIIFLNSICNREILKKEDRRRDMITRELTKILRFFSCVFLLEIKNLRGWLKNIY